MYEYCYLVQEAVLVHPKSCIEDVNRKEIGKILVAIFILSAFLGH